MIAAQRLGPLAFTRPIKVLTFLSVAGIAAVLWRFAAGLGTATALNDGYPWGLWIAFDVVTGTALACGGYAVALLVYAFNRGQYHSLVRPALLTSALGYTMAGFSVAMDVGRPYGLWKVPIYFWDWNLNSALLEVALCITAYTLVVWLELAPAVLERARQQRASRFRTLATRITPRVDRSLTWIIALALLLPTMHQSSLGTLMVLSGPRLHELWQTAWLPLLFLISCVSMGFAAVVIEGTLSHFFLKRPLDRAMFANLAKVVVPLQAAYILLRLADVVARGVFSSAVQPTTFAFVFWLELAFFAAPILMLRGRPDSARLFRTAMVLILGGALYRFDTFLVAFRPGAHYSYFPSVGELAATAGLVSMEILAYILIIHYFPIMSGAHHATAEKAGV
jgi:Ni/Fe-hydrogenase subunit HybB-like protein